MAGHDRRSARGGVIPDYDWGSSIKCIPHAFSYAKEPGAAAVNHAGLLQDVQKLRGMLQAKVHCGNPKVHEFLYGRCPAGSLHALPEDGEDCAFNGL